LLLLLLLAVLYVLLLLLLLLGLRSIAVRRAVLYRHGVLQVHLLLLLRGLLQQLLLVGRIRRGISGGIHRILRLLLLVSRWRTVCLLLWLMLQLLLGLVVWHLTLLLGLLGHAGGGGRIQVLRMLLLLLVLHRVLSHHTLLLLRRRLLLLLVCHRRLLLRESMKRW